jgi:hypothetical protein
MDGLSSSPPLRHTSLPPTGASGTGSSSNSRNGTPRRKRPTADALAFGDEDGGGREQDNTEQRRRRPRQQQMNGDVPIVKDAVGESVRESFEAFLKTYVYRATLRVITILDAFVVQNQALQKRSHSLRHLPQTVACQLLLTANSYISSKYTPCENMN